ncbi:hypothetical protein GH714_012920 [Hevea brasiliensis]|uniref:Root phototropism protein n=1 Tax=Hevea brasiliensis TaxID=3981 RepID=A0A6A6L8K3_HEVBR|nr:hypothetical protein GH714_012920 [Hevea brasiliensis]
MATPQRRNSRLSIALERTGQWVFSQKIPIDIVVEVGEANFALHKFMLVAKSNYIRKLIMESTEQDLTRINLSDIPGGPEMFEKAAKFCYGVNFEITIQNVAALRCAAEYLQMTDLYSDNNLAGRTEDFLGQVALSSLSGAIVALKSCEDLLPLSEDLKIVQRCLDVISVKACNEANFPSRSPPNWWTEELTILGIELCGKIICAMKKRGAKALTLARALITYTERNLQDLVRDHSSNGTKSSDFDDSDIRSHQRKLIQSIVSLMPSEIERVMVGDLLVLSFTYDGERLFDLESVKRIISGFVEKEKTMAVFIGGDFKDNFSPAMQKVTKTVDAYLGEIASYVEFSISKFIGISILVPKGARKVDDDLYRAIDIYLKAHPNLDEIEREKHPRSWRWKYERSLAEGCVSDQGDEALRLELMKMKLLMSDMQKNNNNQGASSKRGPWKKPTFFSSLSKTLGKLNPFRNGSKDTSHIDESVEVGNTTPRRRRFSIS